MLYALICTDKAGALQTRMDNRPAHLDFLNSFGNRLKGAGPFLNEAGDPAGSLVIIEAASMDEAKEIAAADPYAKAGLFENVEIRPWKWVVKNPEAA